MRIAGTCIFTTSRIWADVAKRTYALGLSPHGPSSATVWGVSWGFHRLGNNNVSAAGTVEIFAGSVPSSSPSASTKTREDACEASGRAHTTVDASQLSIPRHFRFTPTRQQA